MDADRYDFGEVLSGEVIVRKITLRNRGGADLALSRFEFSCGCSIPRAVLSTGETVSLKEFKADDPLVLKPGGWAEMELEFSSLGRQGRVAYKMVIHSNDPARPELTIPILARVTQAFELRPRLVRFGTVEKKSVAAREIVISALASGDFRITGFDNLPPFMAYEIEKLEDQAECAYRMQLTLKGSAPAGVQNLILKARVESDKSKGVAIPVSFEILPEVDFLCDGENVRDDIQFGVIERGAGAAKKIHIINRNPMIPYTITGTRLASQFGKFIQVELRTLQPGLEYELLITIEPELDARFLRGFVYLESDHPDLENKRFTLKGMFR
jgi:hypothetical protein